MKTKFLLKEGLKAVLAGSILLTMLVMLGSQIEAVQAAGVKTLKKIKAGSISNPYLGNDAVTAEKIAENAVGWSEIASEAVGGDEIAVGAVGSDEISDGSISSADIGDGLIVTGDIQDGTIGDADISSVSYSKLNLNGSISSADIANGTITGSNISSSAQLSVATDESVNGIDISSGAVSDVTQLDVDNIRLDGNTISATNNSGLNLYDNASSGLVIMDGGNADLNGHIAVGSSATPMSSRLINISETTTNGGDENRGIYLYQTHNFTLAEPQYGYGAFIQLVADDVVESGNDYQMYGLESRPFLTDGSSAYLVTGVRGIAELSNAVGTTVNYSRGVDAAVYAHGTGTISSAEGLYATVSQYSGGTITSAYGVKSEITNSESTIGTGYGLYEACADAGTCYGLFIQAGDAQVTTDWGIFETGADKNYFSGNVGIGTTVPLQKLEVDGIIKTKERSSATCDASAEGGIYYDSDVSHFYGCDGTTWKQLDN